MAFETIAALLAARAAARPGHVAIVDDDGGTTYAELEARSAALAAELVRRGVNKGHRTALLMPNGADWALAAYAVMRIGAVLVPLSTLLRPPELSQQLAVANVRHLIFTDRSPGVALGLLLFGFVVTFASAAMGSAIMALGQRETEGDTPRGPPLLAEETVRATRR